jgi:hypothetical protein
VKTRTLLVGLLVGGVLAGGVVFGVSAAASSSNVTYYACLTSSKTLTGVGTTAPACKAPSKPISWNSAGPQGIQGKAGTRGPQGAAETDFTASGTYKVPDGVSEVQIEAWGGGSGCEYLGQAWGGTGTSGGFTSADFYVTPRTSLGISVGSGGSSITAGPGTDSTVDGPEFTLDAPGGVFGFPAAGTVTSNGGGAASDVDEQAGVYGVVVNTPGAGGVWGGFDADYNPICGAGSNGEVIITAL